MNGSMNREALAVGDQAWCLVHTFASNRSQSGARRTLDGAARVVVVEIPDGHLRISYRVEILRASGAMVGTKLEMKRDELYSVKDRAEHLAFGEEVKRFWQPGWRGQHGS